MQGYKVGRGKVMVALSLSKRSLVSRLKVEVLEPARTCQPPKRRSVQSLNRVTVVVTGWQV